MKMPRLLSVARYRRCAQIFKDPLRVHLLTSLPLLWPKALALTTGGKLQFADARRSKRVICKIIDHWPNPCPLAIHDGLVEFYRFGKKFSLRQNYGDFFTFQEVVVDDTYEIESLPKSLGTVVDLGANIGLFALGIAPLAERVICVEPLRSNIEMAERILGAAGFGDKVKLRRAAIGADSFGTARIYASGSFPAGSSICQRHTAHWGNAHVEGVSKIGIAELFEQEGICRCSLLKCDIEGSEFDAFEGLPSELLRRIDRIAMEVHLTVGTRAQRRFKQLRSQLYSAGFKVWHGPVRRWWGGRRRAVMLRAVNPQAETGAENKRAA